jgi:tRNA U54 and U55 pseudouridine synthase Pus10
MPMTAYSKGRPFIMRFRQANKRGWDVRQIADTVCDNAKVIVAIFVNVTVVANAQDPGNRANTIRASTTLGQGRG